MIFEFDGLTTSLRRLWDTDFVKEKEFECCGKLHFSVSHAPANRNFCWPCENLLLFRRQILQIRCRIRGIGIGDRNSLEVEHVGFQSRIGSASQTLFGTQYILFQKLCVGVKRNGFASCQAELGGYLVPRRPWDQGLTLN